MATETPPMKVTVIRPTKGWVPLRIRELWAYRELLFFLAWRDVKVRYKQTVIGVGWAVIQPLVMALMFYVVFAVFAGISSGQSNYIVFAYTALLPWNLFAKGLAEGSTSLVTNERLVTKVYFPRLILPASSVFAGFVDFSIGFIVLIGLMLVLGQPLLLTVFAVPIFAGIVLISAMGIAFWLSAIDARFRDVRYTLPFLTQLWFFATPIVYPMDRALAILPEGIEWLYTLNPMVGVVQGFRWAVLGEPFFTGALLSLAVVFAMFIGGLFFFRRTERLIADTV